MAARAQRVKSKDRSTHGQRCGHEAKQEDAAGSYAGETLPDLEKHLQIAQSLQGDKTQ